MPHNKDQFKEKGFTIQFLPSELMEILHLINNELTKVPAHHWTQVIKSGTKIKDLPLLSRESAIEHEKALARIDTGELCYSFKRIQCEGSNLKLQAVQQLKTFLLSSTVRTFIQNHTERIVQDLSLFYINKFDHGDFLTTHRDTGQNLAMVISLTSNWDPNNGGITFLLDQDSRIEQALSPQFGQTLILDCSEKTVPHFVSTVTSPAKRYRTAIVARYI